MWACVNVINLSLPRKSVTTSNKGFYLYIRAHIIKAENYYSGWPAPEGAKNAKTLGKRRGK